MKYVGKWQLQLANFSPTATASYRLTFELVSHTVKSLILPVLLNKRGSDGKTTVSVSAATFLQSLHKVENTLKCRLVKYTLKTEVFPIFIML